MRNKIAARTLAAQEAAQNAAAEAARAQASEGGASQEAGATNPFSSKPKAKTSEIEEGTSATESITKVTETTLEKLQASLAAAAHNSEETGDNVVDAKADASEGAEGDVDTATPATPTAETGEASPSQTTQDVTPASAEATQSAEPVSVPSPPPSAEEVGRATAAALVSASCAIEDDTPPTSPPRDKEKKKDDDDDAALAAFPLHTKTSATRFSERLPPSLSNDFYLHLATNVPNDSTTSMVLVDSKGVVHPVGMQLITNTIFDGIKASRSQSFSRFKEDHPDNEALKTPRSHSDPTSLSYAASAFKAQKAVVVTFNKPEAAQTDAGQPESVKPEAVPPTPPSAPSPKDEPASPSSQGSEARPFRSAHRAWTSDEDSSSQTSSDENQIVQAEQKPTADSSGKDTDTSPPETQQSEPKSAGTHQGQEESAKAVPSTEDIGMPPAKMSDIGKKEFMAQQAQLRAAVKFQATVEELLQEEYIRPFRVKAVFTSETSDDVMSDFENKMYEMMRHSFNDEHEFPICKVDLNDEAAIDAAFEGANGVFVSLFDKRGLPWPDMVTTSKALIDAANRTGVEHFMACCVADLECESEMSLPKSIADGRAIREHLQFRPLTAEEVAAVAAEEEAAEAAAKAATEALEAEQEALGVKTTSKPASGSADEESHARIENVVEENEGHKSSPTSKSENGAPNPDNSGPASTDGETKQTANRAPKKKSRSLLPRSAFFKFCTVLSIAVPFESYLSESVFCFEKRRTTGYALETHIPLDEWFPFSSWRDVGPFALQAFKDPAARESHMVSLVSDFTCLRQAAHQAAQLIYHSQHRVSCPDTRDLTAQMFLAGDTKQWYESHDLLHVHDLLTWWIGSKAADRFWNSGNTFPGHNKLTGWRHFIFEHVDEVLSEWRNPDGQWNSRSGSTNTYQFNQETPTFSRRYVSRGSVDNMAPKSITCSVSTTPIEELDMGAALGDGEGVGAEGA